MHPHSRTGECPATPCSKPRMRKRTYRAWASMVASAGTSVYLHLVRTQAPRRSYGSNANEVL